ncbi:MAG TPA: ECF-type sigma factor [Kofleriaceae bacterium]
MTALLHDWRRGDRAALDQLVPIADRAHFFAIAGRTMRQILVDHARRRGRDKRGSGDRPVTLDEDVIASCES